LVVGVLLLAFFVAKGCQDAQIKVSQSEAEAKAKEQVDFVPTRTLIRLLRQGINREPFWIVSMSIPIGDPQQTDPKYFRRLAVVRIDANSGRVVETKVQSPEDDARQVQQAKQAGVEGATP
jgi:hypothetical protein